MSQEFEISKNLKIIDSSLAQMVGKGVIIGKSFIFLDKTRLPDQDKEKLEMGQKEKAIISLWGKEQAEVAGLRMKGAFFPKIPLACITSDKMIYTAGKDMVNLLIVYPEKANESVEISIHYNEQLYTKASVMLDEAGMGIYRMVDLYQGAYTVRIEETSISATFDVAEYQLAPFLARLKQHSILRNELEFEVELRNYDVPFFGEVKAQLQVNNRNVSSPIVLRTDAEGIAEGAFQLPEDEGLVTINFQAKDDAAKTATVLVKGAQTEERAPIVINPLGNVVQLSLAPSKGTQTVRGMYLKQKEFANTPFSILSPQAKEGIIYVRQKVDLAKVIVIDPVKRTKVFEHQFSQLKEGSKISVDVPAPYGVVLIGAFIDGKPWEGYTIFLHPSDISVEISAPEEAEPGENIDVKIQTNLPFKRVPVWMVVRDARLFSYDPETKLASAMKRGMEQYLKRCKIATPEFSLHTLIGEFLWRRYPRHVHIHRPSIIHEIVPTIDSIRTSPRIMMMSMGSSLRLSSAFDASYDASASSGSLRRARAEQDTGWIEEFFEFEREEMEEKEALFSSRKERPRQDFPEILFADLFEVKGETIVPLLLSDQIGQYTIEVFALDGFSWRKASTSFVATKSLWAECSVPPFVSRRDTVWTRLYLSSDSGQVKLEITCDGKALPMRTTTGQSVTPGEVIDIDYTDVQFLTKPGTLRVSIEDPLTDEKDILERIVTEPGRFRYMVKQLILMQPGQTVNRSELGARKLSVLPGLERPFKMLVNSTISYEHACCEQTAARIVAAATMYIFAENDAQRQKAESYILAGIKRQEKMYKEGKGFTIYPEKSEIYSEWSKKAAFHLLSLNELANEPDVKEEIRQALAKLQAMAIDVMKAHGEKIVPEKITNCAEAYQAFTYGKSAQKLEALAFVRSALSEHEGEFYVKADGRVKEREETSYAAAILCQAREDDDFDTPSATQSKDLQRAIRATNWITKQFNSEGRLYSTADSRAAIALFASLQKAGVVAEGTQELKVNGVAMTVEQAQKYPLPIEEVECISGVATVEAFIEREEDWSEYKLTLPVSVELQKDGNPQQKFKAGDLLELIVKVDSYQPGLIAEVSLPACLAYLKAGAQVKRLSIDFAGETEIRVPLVAVAQTLDSAGDIGGQHFAVFVRNMFQEEMISNPGALYVQVL